MQVLTAPRAVETGEDSPLRRAILAGLLDAGVRRTTVATVWMRSAPGAPLDVLIAGGGPDRRPEDASGSVPLLFPLGATGRPVPAERVQCLLSAFPEWRPCTGGFDPLLAEAGEKERASSRGGARGNTLDDVVGYLSHEAFAWLVACTPVPDPEVTEELDTLRRQAYRLRQSKLSESDVVELERIQAWFRELSRAGNAGVWDVRILLGTTGGRGELLAPILCSAAEHAALGYRVRPMAGARLAGEEVVGFFAGHEGAGWAPFRATAEFVAALVRTPETEVPGIRLATSPAFDSTLESDQAAGPQAPIGTLLDRFLRPAGQLSVRMSTVNRHTFVCGATGGGKSQTVRQLLESLSRSVPPVPWLVIEPAKAEYARMAGRIRDLSDQNVLVLTPGRLDVEPVSINPLEPASLQLGNPSRTFPLQSHADLVRALFLAAFEADEPFPQVLSQALTDCYRRAGWDLVTGEPTRRWDPTSGQPNPAGSGPRYPTLGSLQRSARKVVDEIGYGEEVRRNVRGFIDVRVGSLRLGAPGRLFEGGHPLDFAAVLRRNVVVEIESITNNQDKAFVMGALLIRLYEQLLLEERERFQRERTPAQLRHVTVIEEAHRLLRNVPADSPGAHSLELFADLLAEVRAYGEGLVVAEQIPSKLIPDVIKNTALKIVHRLPAEDDRAAVGGTMNMSEEQSAYVVTLSPGTAAVFADGMDRPMLARMPTGEDRESTEPAVTRPPFTQNGRRSLCCGERCRSESACTLLTIRHAEQLLDNLPEITLWMELSFAAHGSGIGAPTLVPNPRLQEVQALAGSQPQLFECLLAHAAERAVSDRYDDLAQFFDPDSLASHLTRVLTGQLLQTDPREDCATDSGRWRFGYERLADVVAQLRKTDGDADIAVKNALGRARERGFPVGAGTPSAQADHLSSLPWAHFRAEGQRLLAVGGEPIPRLYTAAEALVGPGTPPAQLAAASARALRWPSGVPDRLYELLA